MATTVTQSRWTNGTAGGSSGGGDAAVYHPPAVKSFGDFCRTVRASHSDKAHERQVATERLAGTYRAGWQTFPKQVAKAAMGETSGTTGGYPPKIRRTAEGEAESD
jgi:hypothetical protein